jgi:hypothetical protein
VTDQPIITAAQFVERGDHHRLLEQQIEVYLLMPVTKVTVSDAYYILTVRAVDQINGHHTTIAVLPAQPLLVIES